MSLICFRELGLYDILHRKILFIIERRITKDEVLDTPVSAYTEGNTRVIPIVEERVVVTKRLVVVRSRGRS